MPCGFDKMLPCCHKPGMGSIFLEGEPPVEVRLKRHPRARRLSLRVSRLDGNVTLSMPKWGSRRDAQDFARSKEPWIRRQLAQSEKARIPHIGGVLPFEGQSLPIVEGGGRSARLRDGQIVVPGDLARVPARLVAFLKLAARDRLSAACDGYATSLGTAYGRLTLRDTRSRWGSCSAEGNLMFSWRLIMAPPEVLQYVAAHEVAHLLEMNHSSRFWALVGQLEPGYSAPRLWLRRNGASLHSYRFG